MLPLDWRVTLRRPAAKALARARDTVLGTHRPGVLVELGGVTVDHGRDVHHSELDATDFRTRPPDRSGRTSTRMSYPGPGVAAAWRRWRRSTRLPRSS